jgi:hypothetical protein
MGKERQMKSRISNDEAKSRKTFLKKVLKKFPQASYDELRAKVSRRFDGAPVSNSLIAECKRALNLLHIEQSRQTPSLPKAKKLASVETDLREGTVPAELRDAMENCKALLKKSNLHVATIDVDEAEMQVGKRVMSYHTVRA